MIPHSKVKPLVFHPSTKVNIKKKKKKKKSVPTLIVLDVQFHFLFHFLLASCSPPPSNRDQDPPRRHGQRMSADSRGVGFASQLEG